ncbi:MAG: hypothetical protein ACJA0H_001044 [Francisellaceae bacterium]|jgi:hypothetical protein
MYNDSCPICRGRNIENDHCARCSSDLKDLRLITSNISQLYSDTFLAIKHEQYTRALNIISNLKKLKTDSFVLIMEKFVKQMATQQVEEQMT